MKTQTLEKILSCKDDRTTRITNHFLRIKRRIVEEIVDAVFCVELSNIPIDIAHLDAIKELANKTNEVFDAILDCIADTLHEEGGIK